MKLTSFPNGTIQFVPEKKGREETSRTSEQPGAVVTIIDQAIAPVAANFLATFFIAWSREEGGVETSNRMHIDIRVPAENTGSSYQQVENAAAQRIPEELRALADLIQADLDRANAARAERDQRSE